MNSELGQRTKLKHKADQLRFVRRTHTASPSSASGLFTGNFVCDVFLLKSSRKAQRRVQLVMVENSQKIK